MNRPDYAPPTRVSTKQKTPSFCQVGCLSLFLVVAVPVLFRSYMSARFASLSHAPKVRACDASARQLANAIRMYMEDYDGTLPLASNWYDVTTATTDKWHCSEVAKGVGYALDSRVAGEKPSNLGAHQTSRVLLYESSNLLPNASDPGTSFTSRHEPVGPLLVFMDGHIRRFIRNSGADVVRTGRTE